MSAPAFDKPLSGEASLLETGQPNVARVD